MEPLDTRDEKEIGGFLLCLLSIKTRRGLSERVYSEQIATYLGIPEESVKRIYEECFRLALVDGPLENIVLTPFGAERIFGDLTPGEVKLISAFKRLHRDQNTVMTDFLKSWIGSASKTHDILNGLLRKGIILHYDENAVLLTGSIYDLSDKISEKLFKVFNEEMGKRNAADLYVPPGGEFKTHKYNYDP